jgi:hypothetical protein
MLRDSIKHAISRALSAPAGVEIWDFDTREETAPGGGVVIEMRYRYHPDCIFKATFSAATADGGGAPGIVTEAMPGELLRRETGAAATLTELCGQIETWAGRLGDELAARSASRLLAAQQKALMSLGRHLRDLPDRALGKQQAADYRKRLGALERAVLALHTPDATSTARIRAEFAGLADRAGAMGERSFLQAVLVRLVQHFWDEERLGLAEAGARAARDFLDGHGEADTAERPGSRAETLPAGGAARDGRERAEAIASRIADRMSVTEPKA